MVYDQQATEINLFPPMEATTEQHALALHNNVGVLKREALCTARLTAVMSGLCAAAERKGHLTVPAAAAAPRVPVPTAARTAAAGAVAANNHAVAAAAAAVAAPLLVGKSWMLKQHTPQGTTVAQQR